MFGPVSTLLVKRSSVSFAASRTTLDCTKMKHLLLVLTVEEAGPKQATVIDTRRMHLA